MPVTLPPTAAWRHIGARDGFEVVFLAAAPGGHRLEGHVAAVEQGQAWAVTYLIEVDGGWATRRARVTTHSPAGRFERTLEADGAGAWRVEGAPAALLDGCLDVDLEASACTNALPVHRLRLGVGEVADAPAAYLRAVDLAVERLEQRYEQLPDEGAGRRFAYAAPRFDYADRLTYDAHGLVLDYPGLATRVA
jgi:hypothetical protein